MPREFKRADRVADAMQRSVADILRSEMRDPRVGLPNVNAVKVPNDLSVAKVYVTFIGVDDQDQIEEAVAVLNDASGYIRTLVAKEMKMRTVPRIYFVFDSVAVEGQRLSNLIDAAVASDRRYSEQDEKDEQSENGKQGEN